MGVLSANKESRTSQLASSAPFFSQPTAVLQMLLESVTTTGCLHIRIKICSECLFRFQNKRKYAVRGRGSSNDADRKHTPFRALDAAPNAFFYCQINVRYWQITGRYVSFAFQKWTDLGHVLPNCVQCLPSVRSRDHFQTEGSDMVHICYHHLKWTICVKI